MEGEPHPTDATARRTRPATASTPAARRTAAAPSSGVVVSRWGLALVALLGAVELVAFIVHVARRRPTCTVQVVGGQCSARCEP